MTEDRRGQRTVRARAASAAVVLAMIAGVLAGCAADEEPPAAATPPPSTAGTSSTTAGTAPPTTVAGRPAPPAWTMTAVPKGAVQGYSAPGGAPTAMVTSTYYDIPTTLPVREEQGDWLRVGTPYKPNGSSAWVRRKDVTVAMTPWHVELDVTTARVRLFKEGQQVMDAAVGIGTDYTPTATGDFFVTHFQDPPNAGYGPFVMVTSGHSDVIQVWDGFPDGILAFHGPIGSEWAFADVGARISNGCIRMRVADQQQLAAVLPGSPVTIYASPAPPDEEAAPPDEEADQK